MTPDNNKMAAFNENKLAAILEKQKAREQNWGGSGFRTLQSMLEEHAEREKHQEWLGQTFDKYYEGMRTPEKSRQNEAMRDLEEYRYQMKIEKADREALERMRKPSEGYPVPGRIMDFIAPVLPDVSQKNIACTHEPINVGFTHLKMVCKHCDMDL